jgi:hypothetical protein
LRRPKKRPTTKRNASSEPREEEGVQGELPLS